MEKLRAYRIRDNEETSMCTIILTRHEQSPSGSVEEVTVGQTSDGYHTFDELYHHRMMLFAVICNTYPEAAWKSKLHDDGSMYDNYFIVGVTTPAGDYSYHYHTDYWDMFHVKELDRAPEWDGHEPSDIGRLTSLIVNNK